MKRKERKSATFVNIQSSEVKNAKSLSAGTLTCTDLPSSCFGFSSVRVNMTVQHSNAQITHTLRNALEVCKRTLLELCFVNPYPYGLALLLIAPGRCEENMLRSAEPDSNNLMISKGKI